MYKPLVALAALLTFGLAGLLVLAALASHPVIGATPPSRTATDDIPPELRALYMAAADTCSGLDWTVLAAIGKVETDHGRSGLPGVASGVNAHGAAGPMQFGVGGQAGNTWAAAGVDGDGDGVDDVYNPADAVYSAADYLCGHGARGGVHLDEAILAYNPDQAYLRAVLDHAQDYAALPSLDAASAGVQALLGNPRLTLTEPARHDLHLAVAQPGWIDPRVIATLELLTRRHTVTVSVLRTGHSTYVAGTERVSHHAVGRAVDISELDGEPVDANSAAARAVIGLLDRLPGPLRPSEIGSPFAIGRAPFFTDSGHQGHLHVGYGAG